ncbi:hypothetical protein MKX01_035458 [Papaver californicum]|nr:hypothetical protein MKX01_035458 [Papaver californicum]
MEEEKKCATTENENDEIKYGGTKAMPFIIGNEIFEKLGNSGLTSNLLVYLTTVFNIKHVTAVIIFSIFHRTSAFTPLIGGYVADTYLGRFKTLEFAFTISLMLYMFLFLFFSPKGSIFITLTATITKLHPPKCGANEKHICAEPSAPQWAFLFCAFGFLVIGAGGIRPCNLAFGVDQFNPNNEAGRRSINSFINWYYFVLSTSFFESQTLIVYVQSNLSWSIGLALSKPCKSLCLDLYYCSRSISRYNTLSTYLSFIACCIFFMGSRIFAKLKPEGSPVTSLIQVLVAATKKWRLRNLENPEVSLFNRPPKSSINSKLGYTNQFRFLDKAAIVTVKDKTNTDGKVADPWRLCTIQQVEEVKGLGRAIPIWASLFIFQLASSVQHTYVVLQALQIDRHIKKFEVPASSYLTITFLSAFLWIPVYDRVIVPALRKGIALTFPTLGITQNGGAISSMPGFWLIPQLTFIGLSETFNSTAQIEFYYKEFPENMRSIGMSTYILGMAVGNYICGFIVSIVHRTTEGASTGNWLPEDLNKGRLDYFYHMITLVQLVNLLYFLVCSRWYRYKHPGRPTNAAEVEMDSRNVDKSSI